MACAAVLSPTSTPIAVSPASALFMVTWPSQTASNRPLCLLVSTFPSKASCAAGLIFLEHDHNPIQCRPGRTSRSTRYHTVTSHTTPYHVSYNTHHHSHITGYPRPCVARCTLHTFTSSTLITYYVPEYTPSYHMLSYVTPLATHYHTVTCRASLHHTTSQSAYYHIIISPVNM